MATRAKSMCLTVQDHTLCPLSIDSFLHKLFEKYDTNGDGRLTWFEFAEVIRFLTRVTGATFPTRHDIEDIFAQIDKDGDTTITKE